MDTQKVTFAIKPRIEVANLAFAYGPQRVLDEISLTVDQGEIVACMGRSGCGKSTLMKSLALFETPQKGKIKIDGELAFEAGKVGVDSRKHREKVCLVFQEHSLFPNLTGLENIGFALAKRRGADIAQVRAEVLEASARFGLSEAMLLRYPHSYSGGEQQRVALLRALVLRPEVLLLDEPTSALDPDSIVSVIKAIKQLREESVARGMAVLLVTHLAKFAEEAADRIVFMQDGRLIENGPAKDFFSRTENKVIAAYRNDFKYAM